MLYAQIGATYEKLRSREHVHMDQKFWDLVKKNDLGLGFQIWDPGTENGVRRKSCSPKKEERPEESPG